MSVLFTMLSFFNSPATLSFCFIRSLLPYLIQQYRIFQISLQYTSPFLHMPIPSEPTFLKSFLFGPHFLWCNYSLLYPPWYLYSSTLVFSLLPLLSIYLGPLQSTKFLRCGVLWVWPQICTASSNSPLFCRTVPHSFSTSTFNHYIFIIYRSHLSSITLYVQSEGAPSCWIFFPQEICALFFCFVYT